MIKRRWTINDGILGSLGIDPFYLFIIVFVLQIV